MRRDIDNSIMKNSSFKPTESTNNYDILILDKNSDMGDYETSVSMRSGPRIDYNYNSKGLMTEKRNKKRYNEMYVTD